MIGVDGSVVVLIADAVLSARVDFDWGLSFEDNVVCVAVMVGDVSCGDDSRLRRDVLIGSTLGCLPAIVS